MPDKLPDPVVDVDWLHEHLHDAGLIILDASVPPVVPGFDSVNAGDSLSVIPGARRFDYDREVCDPDSSLPHMMPTPAHFESAARQLGIDRDSAVVVYDDVGLYASPRAWWMFRAMGFDRVAVLEGGLPAWLAAGHPVTDSYASAQRAGDFTAEPRANLFCDAPRVLEALDSDDAVVLDARSAGRFAGRDPEPRPNARSGHMPGASNLPFAEVLDQGFLRPVTELRARLSALAQPEQCVITSCGSGITACVLTLAAYQAGYRELQVYDGSWAEWGQPSKLPVV